jgi:hypothetical protein
MCYLLSKQETKINIKIKTAQYEIINYSINIIYKKPFISERLFVIKNGCFLIKNCFIF